MTTYCSKAKEWSKDDMIISYVQREDIINHPYQCMTVPKGMVVPERLKESAGLLNFFKASVESVLP